ncbi:MAG: HEAT repeat domain-containing protein [Spirulinaceae cyanobacterium]
MTNEDELKILDDLEGELSDPLDQLDQAQLPPPPDPEEMLALLTQSEPSERMRGARAFSEITDARATPLLMQLLQETCPLMRVSAAYGLGRNPSRAAVDALIEQYYRDFNGHVRKGIVWALGNCRDRRSVGPLVQALTTDIPAVRLWAASSLAQLSNLEYDDIIVALPPLIEALRQDAIAAIRSNCAWSIGQLCRELPANVVYATAIDALIEALVEDEDLGVTEDARTALLALGDPRGLQMIEELEQEGLV